MNIIEHIICRIFGHKTPFLRSLDGMRYICSRCCYKTFSLLGMRDYLDGGDFARMVRSKSLPLLRFRQFDEIRERLKPPNCG